MKKMLNVYFYTRFERFWHWTQAIMIFTLILTGLEIHGNYVLFGFEQAVEIHNFVGIAWLVLFIFIIFWLSTTGEWKQYIPTTKKLFEVIYYYSVGIFKGQSHPVEKSKDAKHNPLQRLTYLGLSALMIPLQMITGLLYYTYNDWPKFGIDQAISLGALALVHNVIAFFILSFVIIHVYMTTTGHSLTDHIKAMLSGWEKVEEGTKIERWEQRTV